jgi:hypothetical protein
MEDVAVDKTTKLKNVIITKYADLIAQMQKGYKFQKYTTIMEAMKTISFLANFTQYPSYSATTAIDYYLRKLNEI